MRLRGLAGAKARKLEPASWAPHSAPESFSGVPEQRAKSRPIQAQSTAMARTMASICNDERVAFGVMSGHDRKTLRLSFAR
jgi:glycogen debranching enzyme